MVLLTTPQSHRLSPSPPQRQTTLVSLRCSSSITRGAVACQAEGSSSLRLTISIEEVEAGLATYKGSQQKAPVWAEQAAARAKKPAFEPPKISSQRLQRLKHLAEQAAGATVAALNKALVEALSTPELCDATLEELCVLLPDVPKTKLLSLDDAVLLELMSDTALVAHRLVQLRLSAPTAPAIISEHFHLLGNVRWVSGYVPLACFTGDRVTCLAITPDGRQAVSGDCQGVLKVWDLQTYSPACVATLNGPQPHQGTVSAVVITPDGRHAVSGGWDRTLKVWDLATHACVATLRGHFREVTSVAVSPDGRRAVSGSYDKRVCVWDLQTSAPLATLTGHTGTVSSVAVTPDGRRVVAAGHDGTLRVWDLGQCTGAGTCTNWTFNVQHPIPLPSAAVALTGHFAVVGCYDATIQVWDLQQQTMVACLKGHTNAVRAMAISPDGRLAVSGSNDKSVRVWDLQAQPPRCIARLEGHSCAVACVAIAPDGRSAVSAGNDCTVCVWDLQPHYTTAAATSP